MEETTLKQAQKEVDEWIKTIGVKYFDPLTCLAVLMEELGEVARVMARKYGEQSFKNGEKDNLADELADVLFAMICIANIADIDLGEAFKTNMEKKGKRDKNRHKNNLKLSQ